MNDTEKINLMAQTVNPVIKLLEGRLSLRLDAQAALSSISLENVPEAIQVEREKEATVLRAIIQEQRELINLIKIMYPNTK